MRSGLPLALTVTIGFVLACGLDLGGTTGAPCTAEALVEAATQDPSHAGSLRATEFLCADGYARATLETTTTVTDPATALFRDDGGTWSMITIGSAIWGCPQPGIPDDTCHVLLGE